MVRGALQNLATQRETTIKDLLIDTVKEVGSLSGAARHLGVAPNAIRYQIKRHKLVAVRRQERTELVEMEQAS